MAANNSSGFNCRNVARTNRWSQHSFGGAIDLNPVQNPYVTGSADRAARGPGLRPAQFPPGHREGAHRRRLLAVRAFREGGWGSGGAWADSKDYQHFSAAGS